MLGKWMYFILFALGGALLYGWGLKKNMQREQELKRQLYEKGWRVLHRALHRREKLSLREAQRLLAGLTVRTFGSRYSYQVTQPAEFAQVLLHQLVECGKLQEIHKGHNTLYRLAAK